jgi:site-specific DNA-methyltransferase (adenine-specific)
MVLGHHDYHWAHESILYGWKEGAAHNWHSDRRQTTILEFARPQRSDMHPTMKPVEMLIYLVKNSSKKEDIVTDLFGGSGSTLIAAEQTGRKAYLMELDEKYCDVIRKRWAEFTHGEGCNWEELTTKNMEVESV